MTHSDSEQHLQKSLPHGGSLESEANISSAQHILDASSRPELEDGKK